MTTPTTIRQASPRDAFAVAALHLQWGREHGCGPDPAFLDRWADAWLADQERRPFWLADVDGRPVGVAGLQLVDGLPMPGAPAGRRGLVTFLYVTPSFRRCGIGGRLTREVVAWAAAQGVEVVVTDLSALGAAGTGIGRRLGHSAGGVRAAGPRWAAALH